MILFVLIENKIMTDFICFLCENNHDKHCDIALGLNHNWYNSVTILNVMFCMIWWINSDAFALNLHNDRVSADCQRSDDDNTGEKDKNIAEREENTFTWSTFPPQIRQTKPMRNKTTLMRESTALMYVTLQPSTRDDTKYHIMSFRGYWKCKTKWLEVDLRLF